MTDKPPLQFLDVAWDDRWAEVSWQKDESKPPIFARIKFVQFNGELTLINVNMGWPDLYRLRELPISRIEKALRVYADRYSVKSMNV